MAENNQPDLIVHQVIERDGDAKSVWRQIGAMWKNSKGGFTIKLDAVPFERELVALPPKENIGED